MLKRDGKYILLLAMFFNLKLKKFVGVQERINKLTC